MNKKLLLIALPALLAMTGCQAARVVNQPENKAFEMVEDTLAHEEVFGGAQETNVFVPKANPSKAALTESSVKIGYQIQYNSSSDTISIRFLAALTDGTVSAVWHRGLALPNSYEGVEFVYNQGTDQQYSQWKYTFHDNYEGLDLASGTKYTALNNGGVRVVAGETEGYEQYECFAIYTLMGIPYSTYKDSYLAAYVTLTGDNTINSKALAVKIEKDGGVSKNVFFFDSNTAGHFLTGKVGGVVRDGSNDSANSLYRASNPDNDSFYAKYSNVSFAAADSFGAFYYGSSHFQFFGNKSFFDGAAEFFEESNTLSEFSSPKAGGNYTLNVCASKTGFENHFCAIETVGDVQTHKLFNLPNWLANDSATLFAYVHYENGDWAWLSMTSYNKDAGTAVFNAPNNISEFLLARCKPGTTQPNFDAYNEDNGRIWNKTDNISSVSGLVLHNSSGWYNYH